MSEKENKIEYEMAYLLSPEIAEEKLDLEIADIQKIISENGGEVAQSSAPQKRWLAYPVKKQRQASFGVIFFNADKENIIGIKKNLSSSKNVLRFLILNEPLKKPEPVAVIPKTEAERAPETAAPSFDQKLESILNG